MSNKAMETALGIVTSVGGFLEIGSITTAAQAGGMFGYQLVWAVVLGGVCVAFLVEQSGRLAAVSHVTIPDAIRERFGFNYYFVLLLVMSVVSLLVLAAELGGVCIALEFASGIAHQWWVLPVAALAWLIMWRGTFEVIERGVSVLGLVTLCFVVGAVMSGPDWSALTRYLQPTLPGHDAARYWFIAVSILGASITPYLMFFYSSGAIEDKWDRSYIKANRAIAAFGMGFGTLISIAVLVVAAGSFEPRGIHVDDYSQLALLLTEVFGRWGFILVIASLAIACLGAALEVTLEIAYMFAQGLGWNWSENQRPRAEARFSATYTAVLVLAALLLLVGLDPFKLTTVSMALTAATLPVAIVPFLVLMNDRHYLGEHVNGWLSNAVVVAVTALACVLALVTLPLELAGGS
ncbi:MAG: NRAMP family divalent metal transporter [Methanocella sp.]